jgi:hypothetical protein
MGGLRPAERRTYASNNVDSGDLKNVPGAIGVGSAVMLSRLNQKNVHGRIRGIRLLVAI